MSSGVAPGGRSHSVAIQIDSLHWVERLTLCPEMKFRVPADFSRCVFRKSTLQYTKFNTIFKCGFLQGRAGTLTPQRRNALSSAGPQMSPPLQTRTAQRAPVCFGRETKRRPARSKKAVGPKTQVCGPLGKIARAGLSGI